MKETIRRLEALDRIAHGNQGLSSDNKGFAEDSIAGHFVQAITRGNATRWKMDGKAIGYNALLAALV